MIRLFFWYKATVANVLALTTARKLKDAVQCTKSLPRFNLSLCRPKVLPSPYLLPFLLLKRESNNIRNQCKFSTQIYLLTCLRSSPSTKPRPCMVFSQRTQGNTFSSDLRAACMLMYSYPRAATREPQPISLNPAYKFFHVQAGGIGHTALHWCCARGHVAGAQWLLGRGIDANSLNSEGSTPLHAAAANGEAECVAMLLKVPGIQGKA